MKLNLKNKKVLVIASSVLLLIIAIFGISYAYFTASIVGDGNKNQLTVSAGSLKIRYEDGTTTFSTIGDWEPGESVSKTFSVINDSTSSVYYKIYLDDVDTNIVMKEPGVNDAPNEFIYVLKKNGQVIVSEESNTAILESNGILYDGNSQLGIELEVGSTDEYELTLMFLELNKPQDYNQGKYYMSRLSISEPNESTASGKYLAEVKCDDDVEAFIDYKMNGLVFPNYKDGACSLTYSMAKKNEQFNNYIIKLSETPSSNYDWKNGGLVVEEHGLPNTTEYRYEGKNPNNYVWFNDEMWRIIGVFDEATHGVQGENLVKIIRNSALNNIPWKYNNDGYWINSSIYTLLNDYYYNNTNYSEKNGDILEYCIENNKRIATCDYANNGLKEKYQNMIVKNATWILKGTNTSELTAKEIFNYERNGVSNEKYSSEIKTPIGLMYVSDYGYSAGNKCANNSVMYSYSEDKCISNAWLFTGNDEWVLNYSSRDNDMKINEQEKLTIFNIDIWGDIMLSPWFDVERVVRPTVYLKSNVYVIAGDGTENNPYIIS